eukprot:6472315-Amphidinium_carterae.1
MAAQSSVWASVRGTVRLGLVDPRRLFVKNELHTQEKADQGRWRIIWAVSAVDQIFEGLFTKEHNQAVAGSYFKQTWTQSGLGVGHGHSDQFHTNVCKWLRAWKDASLDDLHTDCPALAELFQNGTFATSDLSGITYCATYVSEGGLWWEVGRVQGSEGQQVQGCVSCGLRRSGRRRRLRTRRRTSRQLQAVEGGP